EPFFREDEVLDEPELDSVARRSSMHGRRFGGWRTGPATAGAAAALLAAGSALLPAGASAQMASPARPLFVDGQAQVVEAFADPDRWIRERLWVETEFDSDGDGRR